MSALDKASNPLWPPISNMRYSIRPQAEGPEQNHEPSFTPANMSSTANQYANEVKKHFKTLYANWEPGGDLRLGDYGTLEGNVFVPEGNLEEDYPSEFPQNFIIIRKDGTTDHKEFRSESGVDVTFSAKGSLGATGLPLAKATLEVKFGQKDAIFFDAADRTTERISNKAKVGEVVAKLLAKDKWKSKYCVVTDLVSAGRTILAVSQSSNASITIEAASENVAQINLADAGMDLGFTSVRSIGYKVEAKKGLLLLMGLCQYKTGFLGIGGGSDPRSFRKSNVNIKARADVIAADEMRFVQLGME